MRLERTITEAIAQQAAEWHLEQRQGRLTSSQRVAFVEWLRTSPAHVEAYLSCAAASASLAEAARDWPESRDELLAAAEADVPEQSVVPAMWRTSERETPAKVRGPFFGRGRIALAVGTLSMACIVLVAALLLRDGERFGLARPLVTAHGEQGSWPLPDGSILHLNSGSKAIVEFSGSERLVKVLRGQAMFQVAKDPSRRFRVSAGETQIVALGTEFDVFRHGTGTQVTVLEGRVAVLKGPAPSAVPTLAIAGATELKAGQRVDVDAAQSVPAPKLADLRSARAWLQREIVFENQPLGQVVADFNRYTRTPIEIEDDGLRALPVTGVFGAYDVESFLIFVSRLDGVRVEKDAARIRILLTQPQSSQPIIARH